MIRLFLLFFLLCIRIPECQSRPGDQHILADSLILSPLLINSDDSVSILVNISDSLLGNRIQRQLLQEIDLLTDEQTVNSLVDFLFQHLKKKGYPSTEIRLLRVKEYDQSNEERLIFEFFVDPLVLTQRKNIRFEGNARISSTYLKKFISPVLCHEVNPCDDQPLDQETIDRILSRLDQMNGLESSVFSGWSLPVSQDSELLDEENSAGKSTKPSIETRFKVSENKLSRIDGVIGITNQEGKALMMGNLHLVLPVLTGYGGSAEAVFERHKPYQTRSKLMLSKQMLSVLPVDAGIGYTFYQEDSLYLESHIQTDVKWISSDQWTGGLNMNYMTIRTGRTVLTDDQINKSRLSAGYSIAFHPSRNHNLQKADTPETGFTSSVRVEHSFSSDKFLTADLMLSYMHELYPHRWYALIKGRGQFVYEKELTYPQLIHIGGVEDLPGLNPAQFRARNRIQGDSEIRWMSNSDLWFSLFSTTAHLSIPDWQRVRESDRPIYSDIMFKVKWIHSIGTGMALRTRSGWIHISTAWTSADRFNQARVLIKWVP